MRALCVAPSALTNAIKGASGNGAATLAASSLSEKTVVIPARFERATYRLGICCSILLSYGTNRRFPYRKMPQF